MLELLGPALSITELILLAYITSIILGLDKTIYDGSQDAGVHFHGMHATLKHTNSLLDEMIDEAVAGEQAPQMAAGGLIPTLLHAFMSKNPMGLEHGTSEDGTIQENNPQTDIEIQERS